MSTAVTHKTLTVDYRDWLLGQGLGERTVRHRVNHAQNRLTEWGGLARTPAEVSAYLSGYDQWTRYTYYQHLRLLYRFLTYTGRLSADPTATIRRPRTPSPTPKPLSQDELDRLLETAPNLDMRAILLLASKAGLRLHEIAKIRGEDITEHGLVVLGKGHKLARLPIHPAIRDIAEQYPSSGWWFPSPHQRLAGHHVSSDCIGWRVKQHFRSLNIPGGIHRCRATYGTNLARRGVPMHVVQDLMRHSSLVTTQCYLGIDEDERTAAIGVL